MVNARSPLLVLLAAPLAAQFTGSGSNGSDGNLDLQLLQGQQTRTVVFDPDASNLNPARDNIFHFQSITIGQGVTVVLRASKMRNRPVVWLASGAVTIAGTLDLSGNNGHDGGLSADSLRTQSEPGPGGYPGGLGQSSPSASPTAGSGPVGGTAACDCCNGCPGGHAPSFGNALLVPLTGGSGGGGGSLAGVSAGCGGGAGGGAIRIVSSVSITVNGSILATGGGTGASCQHRGGGGAGGGIHLIAPVISGAGTTSAVGGSSSFSGGPGRIRLDATTFTYTGSASPQPARGAPFNPPLPTNYPSVRVVSVGGVSVPLSPNNSFVVPDVLLNSASAVPVAVQASNIPVGTVVTLVLTPEIGGRIPAQTSPLSGSVANSTATAQVLFPTGTTRVFVSAKW